SQVPLVFSLVISLSQQSGKYCLLPPDLSVAASNNACESKDRLLPPDLSVATVATVGNPGLVFSLLICPSQESGTLVILGLVFSLILFLSCNSSFSLPLSPSSSLFLPSRLFSLDLSVATFKSIFQYHPTSSAAIISIVVNDGSPFTLSSP
ncbi:hypothetical protein ACLOJK_019871, partial [Asimina triloba]